MRAIVEVEANLEIPTLGDDRTGCPNWADEMKNTLDNAGPGMGDVMVWLEKVKQGKENASKTNGISALRRNTAK